MAYKRNSLDYESVNGTMQNQSVGSAFDYLARNGYQDFANYLSSGFGGLNRSQANSAIEKGYMMSPAEMMTGLFNNQLAYQQYMDTQSFQAQVSQMQEAGLNPNLMYGESGGVSSTGGADSGSASSGSFANPNGAQSRIFGALSSIMQMSQMGSQLRGLNLDNQKKDLENGILAKLLGNKDTEIRNQNRFMDDQHNNMVYQGNLLVKNAENISMDTYLKKSEIDINKWKEASAMYGAKMASIDANAKQELTDQAIAINGLIMQKYGAEIKNINMDTLLKDTEISKKLAEITEIGKRCQLLSKDISSYELKTFMAYISTSAEFIDSTTNMFTSSPANLLPMNMGQELWRGITGNVLQSIKDNWGKTGFYSSQSGDMVFPGINERQSYYGDNFGAWWFGMSPLDTPSYMKDEKPDNYVDTPKRDYDLN